MATLMKSTNNGWKLLDNSGNVVLTIANNTAEFSTNITLPNSISCKDSWGSTTSSKNLETILNNIIDNIDYVEGMTCLKEDTDILMMDGSSKKICDVRYGDYVKSWDPLTKTYINAKCYGAFVTAQTRGWETFVFDNGSLLQIRQSHTIFSAKKNEVVGSKIWKVGDKGCGLDGAEITLVKKATIADSINRKSYILIVENNLYFANGVLVGHFPNDKINAYYRWTKAFSELTPEELEFFKATGEIYDKGRRLEIDEKDYLTAAAPTFGQINIAKQKIDNYKKSLAKKDYKTIKYIQGDLSEEEFYTHATEAKALREKIAEQEDIISIYNKHLEELREQYNIKPNKMEDIYKEAFTIDIEHTRNNGYN